jgi:ferritin-like metal-binding protein YciE
MKKLTSLLELLAYQLEAMYDAEKKLQHTLPVFYETIKSAAIKQEVKKYTEIASDKRTKLKRIFSYLLVERFGRKNEVIDSLLHDTQETLSFASTDHLRETALLTCIQNINNYKMASYHTAEIIAIELNLETVADLLHEILEWEKETDRAMTKIAIEELRYESIFINDFALYKSEFDQNIQCYENNGSVSRI